MPFDLSQGRAGVTAIAQVVAAVRDRLVEQQDTELGIDVKETRYTGDDAEYQAPKERTIGG